MLRSVCHTAVVPLLFTGALLPVACGGSEAPDDRAPGLEIDGLGGAPPNTTDSGDMDEGMEGAAPESSVEEENEPEPKEQEERPQQGSPKQDQPVSEEPEEPECVPEPDDLPDDEFLDENCDGIDGNAQAAIFVAPNGNELGAGTIDDPLLSINTAIALAAERETDVYVCNGVYQESVLLDGASVSLYGGYDCENGWSRIRDRAEIVVESGLPLFVRDVADVTIERLVFHGADTTKTQDSSLGGVVMNSKNVVLRRVEFEAGSAGPGEAGEDGGAILSQGVRGADGGAGCTVLLCPQSGEGGLRSSGARCPDGNLASPGGAGGDGAAFGVDAQAGTKGGGSSGGIGGMVSLEARHGSPGGPGHEGQWGAASPQTIGSFLNYLYVPSGHGNPGAFGARGSGGGGGAGGPMRPDREQNVGYAGYGGGQGGFGGCGGYPGQGGSPGGGSFGLVLVNSEVSLSWARLLTGDGGRGGAAGKGGPGQKGGEPGTSTYGAGTGGPGGDGGDGGAGSPGAGGPVVGLALVNSALNRVEDVQVLLGNPGFGGQAQAGNRGPDGLAFDGYDFVGRAEISF